MSGWVHKFVRTYEIASKRVHVVPRHHFLKCMAFVIAIICNSMPVYYIVLQTAPTKPTESTVMKPADIARISRRARSRTDVAPTDVKPGSSQTCVRL